MLRKMYLQSLLTVLILLEVEYHLVLSVNTGQNPNCIDWSDEKAECLKGCTPGYQGPFCNDTCSENCAGGRACSQDTGHCLTGCKPNWFTSNCSVPCSGHCRDNICDQRSGECLRGCQDGYYSFSCNETCSENCTGGICDIYGGCTCKKGVNDTFCYIDCTENCVGGHCAVDKDGQLKCLQGCKEGRMGNFCKEWCPIENESSNACPSKTKYRYKRDANCRDDVLGKCKDGFRGSACDIPCPPCLYSENCTLYCAGGSWGSGCHLNCPQNCSWATNGRSGCDRRGLCHSGCLQGYYGYVCDHPCPETCESRYCFMNNGSCSNGCRPEYWGPFCDKRCGHCMDMKCERNGSCTCVTGFYGPRCKNRCSDHCESKNCSIDINGTHICNGDCKPGYNGVDCLSRCPPACDTIPCDRENSSCISASQNDSSGGTNTAVIVLSSLLGAISLALIVAFLIYWFIYRHGSPSPAPPKESHPVQASEDKPEEQVMMSPAKVADAHVCDNDENTNIETGNIRSIH